MSSLELKIFSIFLIVNYWAPKSYFLSLFNENGSFMELALKS